MRAVVQRVSRASVAIDGQIVGECGAGLCVLVAAHREDDEAKIRKMADKLLNLRIFNDAEGKMNLSILDKVSEGLPYGFLVVSNFTVYGDASKSRRPSFIESAGFDLGKLHFDRLLEELRKSGLPVGTGVFGGDMSVDLVNDGPVTLIVET
jgi:D-tyrosyl-tRNA(Tyr) deacylase